MPRVICELPNASDEIGGVKFYPLDQGGMISDEIGEEAAARFASIPGYSLDEEAREPEQSKQPETPAAPKLTKAQLKALEKKEAAEKAAEDAAATQQQETEDAAKSDAEEAKGEAAKGEAAAGTDEEVF